MKPVEWKTYRTRFLVQAKQLNSALSFIDSLGRVHCGRKGDYLVESAEGVITITPRQIFEDIYVSMSEPEPEEKLTPAELDQLPIQALAVEHICPQDLRRPVAPAAIVRRIQSRELTREVNRPESAAKVRRKLPQSCRENRSSGHASLARLPLP